MGNNAFEEAWRDWLSTAVIPNSCFDCQSFLFSYLYLVLGGRHYICTDYSYSSVVAGAVIQQNDNKRLVSILAILPGYESTGGEREKSLWQPLRRSIIMLVLVLCLRWHLCRGRLGVIWWTLGSKCSDSGKVLRSQNLQTTTAGYLTTS